MMRQSGRPADYDSTDDAIADIGPIDDDVALTADYLAGEATQEQIADFERRFVHDDAFAAKIAPFIKAWTQPGSYRDLIAGPSMELAAEKRVPVNAAMPQPAAKATAPAPSPATHELPRQPFGRTASRVSAAIQLAAAIVVLVVMPAMYYLILRPSKAKVIDQALIAITPRPAPDSATRGARIIPNVPVGPPTRLQRDSTAFRVPVGEADRIKPILAAMGQEFRTAAAESTLIELENGTRVLLRPNSVLHYRAAPRLTIGLSADAARVARLSAAIALEGEAAIDVPPGDGRRILLASDAGTAALQEGSFGARCARECALLEISVAEGSALLYNNLDDPTPLTLAAGQYGVAPRVDVPLRVERRSASQFPAPDPSIRKKP